MDFNGYTILVRHFVFIGFNWALNISWVDEFDHFLAINLKRHFNICLEIYISSNILIIENDPWR